MDRTVVQPFGILDGIIPENGFPQVVRQALYPLSPAAFCRNGYTPHPFLLSLLHTPKRTRIRFSESQIIGLRCHSTWEGMKVSARQPTVIEAWPRPPAKYGTNELYMAPERHQYRPYVIQQQHPCQQQTYKKYMMRIWQNPHLFQSYTNTLLLGQTVWPDLRYVSFLRYRLRHL